MIEIKPIQNHQKADVRRVILQTARDIYQWKESLEEINDRFEKSGELSDIDNSDSCYSDQQGIFLVVTDDTQVIGSGAIRRINPEVCELKRLWLLEAYQGKGIGYQVFQKLVEFARKNDYKRIWLETDCEQKRAIRFYKRIGFCHIPKYNDRNSDVYMGIEI